MPNQHDRIVVAAMRAYGIARPEAEYRFDESRRWRFDYAWPEQRVALEVEGGVWVMGRHTRGSGFVRDMEKYNAAAVMGWRVLRTTPSDLLKAETLAMVREALTGAKKSENNS